MNQPITEKEHLIILDALVVYMAKMSDEKHPIIHHRVFDVYQKVGGALGEKGIVFSWGED